MNGHKRIPIRDATPQGAQYVCDECPAYCCSYPLIEVSRRDIAHLAAHFGIAYAEAEARFTKLDAAEKVRALRHRQDTIFKSVCQFLDSRTRQCSVYEARPETCRDYPDNVRCGYYEFLTFEREHQDDPAWVALT